MVTLSTNCTCYLLTSQLARGYTLNAHTQYQLYLLPSHLPNSYPLNAHS